MPPTIKPSDPSTPKSGPEHASSQSRSLERRPMLRRVETLDSETDSEASYATAPDVFGAPPSEPARAQSRADAQGVQLPRPKSTTGATSRADSATNSSRSAQPSPTPSGQSTPAPAYSPTRPPQWTAEPLTSAQARPTQAKAPTAPSPRSLSQTLKLGLEFAKMAIARTQSAYRYVKALPAKAVAEFPIIVPILKGTKAIAVGALQLAVAVAPLAIFCSLAALPGGLFAFGLVVLLIPVVAMLAYKTHQLFAFLKERASKDQDEDQEATS